MERCDIDLRKIEGNENLADPLTKPIGTKEFEDYKRKIVLDTQLIGFSSSGSLLRMVS